MLGVKLKGHDTGGKVDHGFIHEFTLNFGLKKGAVTKVAVPICIPNIN